MVGWPAAAIASAAVILGGGCGGNARFSCCGSIFCSFGSSVNRLRIKVRLSVVGCGEVDVEHLHFGHLNEHGPRCQSRQVCPAARLRTDVTLTGREWRAGFSICAHGQAAC